MSYLRWDDILGSHRYPFLEGRPTDSQWRDEQAQPLPVDNRTVLHLLEALQFLRVSTPGGGSAERQRLSFRALGIEQIGHVYEGLLDHTAKRATEPVVSLKGSRSKNERKEPEVRISLIEDLETQGRDRLIKFLRAETGRSASSLEKALDEPPHFEDSLDQSRWLAACGSDEQLLDRIRPFVALVREDSFGRPVVILPGSAYVTAGASRRTSASYYTPPSLTEPIVKHTLEPVVYEGPAEGLPPDKWKLRSPKELLDLKVCDMACGSGAFLVQTCRYLSGLLVEAWERIEEQHKQQGGSLRLTPYGDVSKGLPNETLIPNEVGERLIYATRLVAERCVYGVDRNPLAIEMAKLSLWLTTLDKGRPFTFLDHAIKCGDSLLGVASREQMETFHIAPHLADDRQMSLDFWEGIVRAAIAVADEKRRRLESFPVVEVQDIERKERLLSEAEAATRLVRIVCDLLAGAAVEAAGSGGGKSVEAVVRSFESRRNALATAYLNRYRDENVSSADEAIRSLAPVAQKLLDGGKPQEEATRRPFHWPVEFPEVFVERGGFDAIVGNPPLWVGRRSRARLGRTTGIISFSSLPTASVEAPICAPTSFSEQLRFCVRTQDSDYSRRTRLRKAIREK